MCGIAGIFHYADALQPIDRDALVRMTRALVHRGPDDEGIHVEGSIGLGHRRLSIVDLSPTGHQPMPTDDGEMIPTMGTNRAPPMPAVNAAKAYAIDLMSAGL